MAEEKLYTLLDNVKRQDLEDFVCMEKAINTVDDYDLKNRLIEYQNGILEFDTTFKQLKVFRDVLADIRKDDFKDDNTYNIRDYNTYFNLDLLFRIDEILENEGEE